MADLAVLDVSFDLGTHALPDILSHRKFQYPRCTRVTSSGSVADCCDDSGRGGFVIVIELFSALVENFPIFFLAVLYLDRGMVASLDAFPDAVKESGVLSCCRNDVVVANHPVR